MICKVCGHPIKGKPFKAVWGKVVEIVCQTCRFWALTGKVYRRI